MAGSHTLTGHFPTEIIKTYSLTEDGEVEETVTGEGHRPGHLSGNHVECSCGEEWEGVDAEEKTKKHLLRQNATDLIYERYRDVEHRGWTLHKEAHGASLCWSHENDDIPLSIYATPYWADQDGIAVQVHNIGGEELVVKNIAEDREPGEIIENYVEIVTSYIDENWMSENNGGESQ